ncbi:MAG: hypothetical protein IKZ95_05885 [Lachnospiraceae bacterium]|nr:hypothetical protein [Lachnospiraceae bacterium]
MKIGVCFKIVPDFEEVPIEEWSGENGPDFTYVKKMYGCFDEAALETALCLKDSCKQSNIDVEAVAVTVGAGDGAVSESLLRGLFAAGFDDVVLLPKRDTFDPEDTARALVDWFKMNPADLIFTGRSTGPNDSGLMPYYLARGLGFPVIGEVISARWDNSVMLSHMGSDQIKAELPCVITVGNSDTPILRLFPLKARMEAQKRAFTDQRRQTEHAENGEWGMRDDKIMIRGEKITDANCQIVDGKEAAAFLMKKISEVK